MIDKKSASAWVFSSIAVLTLSFVSFNAGFDIGADTSACVAFSLTGDIPEQRSEFCEKAKPVTYAPIKQIRHFWLSFQAEEPSHD